MTKKKEIIHLAVRWEDRTACGAEPVKWSAFSLMVTCKECKASDYGILTQMREHEDVKTGPPKRKRSMKT